MIFGINMSITSVKWHTRQHMRHLGCCEGNLHDPSALWYAIFGAQMQLF